MGSSADGDGDLGEHFNAIVPGGRVHVTHVGTAGRESAGPRSQVTLDNAAPSGATIEAAWLYLGTIGTSADTSVTLDVGGTSVTLALIGTGGPTCWPDVANTTNINRAYRADVTSFVDDAASWTVSGFPSSIDPAADSQGLALVVIERAEDTSFQSQIIINDGVMTNVNPATGGFIQMDDWLENLMLPANLLDVRHFTVMGDAQATEDQLRFVGEQLGGDDAFSGPEELMASRRDSLGPIVPDDSVALLTQSVIPFGSQSWDCLAWLVNGVELSGGDEESMASSSSGVGGQDATGSGGSEANGAGSGGDGGGVAAPPRYGVERGDGCQCSMPRRTDGSAAVLVVVLAVALRRRRSRSRSIRAHA